VGVQILTNFLFWGHNFGSKYGTKPIKGSKDSDGSLKNLEPKIGSLDWRPGPGKVGHKNAETPLLVTLFFQWKLEV